MGKNISKPAPRDMLPPVRPVLKFPPNSANNWRPSIQILKSKGNPFHSNHHIHLALELISYVLFKMWFLEKSKMSYAIYIMYLQH